MQTSSIFVSSKLSIFLYILCLYCEIMLYRLIIILIMHNFLFINSPFLSSSASIGSCATTGTANINMGSNGIGNIKFFAHLKELLK